MFEKEIQTAKQQLSSHLLTGDNYVYLNEVLSRPEVHGFYKTFFRSEVDWWIYEQRMLREVNPRFNFADEEFSRVLGEFDCQCRRTARFDHAELTSLIDLAVKTRVNYLLRPRTTLKWFIYRGEPTKPLREVLLRFAYFDCYSYLTNEFTKWANAKLVESSQQDILSVIEFERLIENIDNDIILEHTTSEFTHLLAPLYDFFNEVQPEAQRDVIPTPALIIFLDDKGILRISQELERLMKENDLDVVSRDQFLRVIDDVINQVEEEAAPEYVDATTIPLDFDRSTARKADAGQPPVEPTAVDAPVQAAPDVVVEAGLEAVADAVQAEPTVVEADTVPVEETPDAVVQAEPTAAGEVEQAAPENSAGEGIASAEVVPEIVAEAVPETPAEPAESEPVEAEKDEAIPLFELPTTFFKDKGPEDEQADADENFDMAAAGESEAAEDSPGNPAMGATVGRALDELMMASAALRDFPEPEETNVPADSEQAIETAQKDATADGAAPANEIDEVPAGDVAEAETQPAAEIAAEVPEESEAQPVAEPAADTSAGAPATDESEFEIAEAEADSGKELFAGAHSDEFVEFSAEEVDEVFAETSNVVSEEPPVAEPEAPAIQAEIIDPVPDAVKEEPVAAPGAPVPVQSKIIDLAPDAVAEEQPVAAPEAPTPVQSKIIDPVPDAVAEEQPVAEPGAPTRVQSKIIDPVPDATEEAELPDLAAFYTPGKSSVELSADDGTRFAREFADEPFTVDAAPEPEILFTDDEPVAEEQAAAHSANQESRVQADIPAIPAAPSGPLLRTIEELMDDSLKQRVLKHIFHKNEGRFRSVLERLNATYSWREASAIIDRVFSEHEVDPYSSIAKKFSDVVYKRFSAG